MTKTHKEPRNWIRIVLVVSLALNLVVVGIVAGVAFKGGPKSGAQRFDLSVGPLTRAMDASQRDALRTALRDSGAFERANRSDIRRDMIAMAAALRAPEFNKNEFRETLIRQRGRLQTVQDAAVDAVTDIIADMSADERAAFADRLEEQRRRGPQPRQLR